MTTIKVAKAGTWLELPLSRANRHGLIAGATGTGKTVSLRVLAEGFSAAGVPCFVADVKGDIAGLSQPGTDSPRIRERVTSLGVDGFAYEASPVIFWDLFGEQGHPVRATVSEIGPILLGRMLELNDTQTSVLNLAFKIADDNGLLLVDLKDLRALLTFVNDHAKELTVQYGNVATATVGTIQRALLALETQGGDHFIGEPELDFVDFMRQDARGRGAINVLAADKLMMRPRLYATFLLWLLAELFERLPEEGDLDKPKLVFFFDEAHLLFNDAPPALIARVEQMVRLIRSKGVGVYFCTQSPTDVPETVLGQLGHRIQHALRAFTPKDQRAVKTAADTFRPNPNLDTARAITELAVGEALVSLLDDSGTPGVVERAMVAPPRSRLGAITPAERAAIVGASPLLGKYEQAVDRQSAFEQLRGDAPPAAAAPAPAWGAPTVSQPVSWPGAPGAPAGATPAPAAGGWPGAPGSAPAQPQPAPAGGRQPIFRPGEQAPAQQGGIAGTLGSILGGMSGNGRRQGLGETIVKSVARNVAGTVGRQVATQILRGLFGSMRR
ncbi:MAG: DUF853 family protein [Alphaproteobacteria bacterium]|nr:DUF853 family protein [Alphaproteobacteria bacterium]